MKAKKTVPLLLAITFIFSTMATASASLTVTEWTPTPPPDTWLYVDDYEFFDEANLTGTEFNVTVKLFNVTNLGSIAWRLGYNTTLLDGKWMEVGSVINQYMGDFVPAPWNGTIGIVDAMGYCTFGCVVKDYRYPYSGDCVVMTVTFEITLAPPREEVTQAENRTVSCAFDLYDITLEGVDPDTGATVPFDYDIRDGSYKYIRPQKVVGEPTAVCSVSPTTQYVCENVTFDGSESDDGGAPPLTYKWDVGSDGTFEITTTEKTASWHSDVAGVFNVSLTVINDMGLNDTSTPQQFEYIEKLGCILDIFTGRERFAGQITEAENVGKGANNPADAFAPGGEVTLYADVTYNGKPVNHVFVYFEISDPSGVWGYRSAETNKTGIAVVSLRIPVPDEDPWLFGKWNVTATCVVADVIQTDTLRFDVGWILDIVSLSTQLFVDGSVPEDTFYSCETMVVIVTVKNIAWIQKHVCATVTVYDENKVPIAYDLVQFNMTAGAFCSPETDQCSLSVHIPTWAYVGAGEVYVNLGTCVPSDGGVVYCPEKSAGITIKIGTRP